MQMRNMVRVFAVALAVVNGWSAIAQSITWIGRPREPRYSIFVSFFAAGAGISEDGRTLVQASDVPYPYVYGTSLVSVPATGRILNCIS